MNIGDLVKIVRAPVAPVIATVGRVGVIESVHDDGKALVQFLKPTGDSDGAAFVPTDCLKVTNHPAPAAMLAAHRQSVIEAEQIYVRWRRQRRREIEAVARRYDMTVEQILEITEAVICGDAHIYY